jgi:predicted nuclease with RNAse H fold
MSENTRQIIFRGTEEYRAQLQKSAIDRGIKVQQLIEQAIEMYLHASNGNGGEAQRAQRHLIAKARAYAAKYRNQKEALALGETIFALENGTLLALLRD